MKKFLLLFVLLLVGSPVMAAGKVTVIKPLSISVDHGINLTLDAPATSVFVANPEIADVQVMSPTSIMIFGKRTGETSFVATDSNGKTLEQRTISVTQDLSNLRHELDLAIPGHKIHAAALPNGLVLTGDAKDAATVADAYKMAQRYLAPGGDIINRIRVSGSNQIHIRVRFAEVQRNIDNTLGFDWQNLSNVGGFVLGIATGNIVNAAGTGTFGVNTTTGLFPRPNNTTLNLPNDAIGIQRSGKHFNIQGMIDALAQDGLITILAEPNLTAMSGETANFLAGGEFPIPIPQGNNLISIEFKKYGVSLEFTPTLVGENRISLHVKPEVSELTSTGSIVLDNITVPALLTRRAETTVEVASGQSFAIAGLLDNQQSETVNKYPLLGDLPVLGALFRSNRFQNGQTELVIIVTPYIAAPNGDQQLALPTDGLSPPTESERLLGLRYSNGDPNARPMSGDPVAVRGETAQSPALAAPPESAPVSAVTPSPVLDVTPPASQPLSRDETPAMPTSLTPPEAPAVKTSVKLNPARVTSSNLSPESSAPSGPGGFILE
jgi:pilus assembly protein CpaC